MENITETQKALIKILADIGISSQKISEIMQFLQEEELAQTMLKRIIKMYDNKKLLNQETIMKELANLF